MNISNTRKTSVNLPVELSKKLKLLAIVKDTNQSELIKEYVKKGIEEDEDLIKNVFD